VVFARLASAATGAAQRTLGARTETVETGGWRIRLHRVGPPGAEPWILLHGLGATSATFLPLERHLRGEVELWLPELSELGGTTGLRAAMTVPEGIAALTELLDRKLGDRSVTLAGISLGGWLAARLAAARPERVARLLLVVPGGYRDQDWRAIERMVRVSTYEDTRAAWRALFSDPPWYLAPGRYLLFLAYTSRAVSAVLETVREEDAFGDDELGRLDLPVGLIWGAEDTLFRVEVGQRMLAALPRGRLWSIPNAGHAVQWQRPREFLAAIDEFRAAFPLLPGAAAEQDGTGLPAGGARWPRPTI
jgi:2-hydroxy-6-oxonona-2,4-dienedioate hydrolase